MPVNNYQARSAVAALSELARKALSEARSVGEVIQKQTEQDHPFTPRETEVLKLVTQGMTNKEIAYRLSISERTVQFHLNSIFNKTGASSRTEAAALAILNRWIVPERLTLWE